jgi:hypothetical protein
MVRFQPPELVWLEEEQGRLDSGEKRGAKNQHCDEQHQDCEDRDTHFQGTEQDAVEFASPRPGRGRV